jgi:hypothetical protein
VRLRRFWRHKADPYLPPGAAAAAVFAHAMSLAEFKREFERVMMKTAGRVMVLSPGTSHIGNNGTDGLPSSITCVTIVGSAVRSSGCGYVYNKPVIDKDGLVAVPNYNRGDPGAAR